MRATNAFEFSFALSLLCPESVLQGRTDGRVEGFPHISALLLDSARNNNPEIILRISAAATERETLESKSSADQKSVVKSEVSQLPQRRGLILRPILSADVNKRPSVRYGPGNVGMPEQVMSPCALVGGGGRVVSSAL
ncbi:hypothetical protein Q8A67_023187 [Cirrhinus molitorella]|uniref:Uncharacterized protein n=1 Tax=Cirrhinus molitorella TaxID=172907 RepID=A0AA88P5E8_9TELE|nr:hypothetical protein Q8A67_023187 [Cirrhinus molitorella]